MVLTRNIPTRRPVVMAGGAWIVLAIFGVAAQPGEDRLSAAEPAGNYRVQPAEDGSGWNVYEGDQLVAGYLFDSNGKPIVYPLVTRDGHELTRDFPMREGGPNERKDHDHHRSLWLTHGEVNGIDFWLDDADRNCGTIRHRRGSAAIDKASGAAVIDTENDWLAPDGERVLSDRRRFTFRTVDGRRVVDCEFELIASEGDVNFGDTKEGTFGIRVAGTMKADADPGGTITNADGQQGKDAWGQESPWVDYSGPVDGETVGITVHYHPTSFSFPCRWHVRTYGLFAANPFGVHHFVGGDRTDGHTLPSGDSLRMNFRVVLHDGEFEREQAESDFAKYAEQEPSPL